MEHKASGIAKRILTSVALSIPTVIVGVVLRKVFEVWGIFDPFSEWLGEWLKMHVSPEQAEWTAAAVVSVIGYIVALYFVWRYFRAPPSPSPSSPPSPSSGFISHGVGPMVPGTGPITAVTLFAGRIFAIRNGKVWCLTDDEWVEITIPNKNREQT